MDYIYDQRKNMTANIFVNWSNNKLLKSMKFGRADYQKTLWFQ